ncbi:hypothetical protein [Natronococcus sp. A-GB7]|uniref:hypothetical protein n=1 Tax=Natronococcus sp. A-GB7 TaxID=3037649 RepID=UPI00241E94F2|nr:hypothetical protein [Natronococcus sp. A-GB7]MDG5821239.1 hypothetical protein [Natronococcus sp. A-GB7]
MNDDTPERDTESPRFSPVTRRTALGVLGTSAVGIGAAGSASADGHEDEFHIEAAGPNVDAMVTADGEGLPDEPDPETELFDAEPEFPPFVNFEQMREEHNSGAVNRYLQEHGVPNLLSSRRLVVQPDAEADGAATWEEFSGASATATVEPASASQGGRNCSHVTVEFDGLYPDGIYTVWVVHEPGNHRPLGGNDGGENAFTADGDGHYTLEAVDHPDELTLPPAESGDDFPITQQPLHEIPGEFFFVVAYHYDNRTWGPQPGPFWVPQLVINQFDH